MSNLKFLRICLFFGSQSGFQRGSCHGIVESRHDFRRLSAHKPADEVFAVRHTLLFRAEFSLDARRLVPPRLRGHGVPLRKSHRHGDDACAERREERVHVRLHPANMNMNGVKRRVVVVVVVVEESVCFFLGGGGGG